jgi:hypothetical protein
MLMEDSACSMRLRLHGVLEARESVKICVIRVIRVPFKLNLDILKSLPLRLCVSVAIS